MAMLKLCFTVTSKLTSSDAELRILNERWNWNASIIQDTFATFGMRLITLPGYWRRAGVRVGKLMDDQNDRLDRRLR